MPLPLSFRVLLMRMAAMPIWRMAGMKNVTVTSAPEMAAPFASVNFTRHVLFPFRGGAGSVLNSIVVGGAFITLAAPAPGGGGTNEPSAAWSWLSESIRKLADVMI